MRQTSVYITLYSPEVIAVIGILYTPIPALFTAATSTIYTEAEFSREMMCLPPWESPVAISAVFSPSVPSGLYRTE